MATKERQGKDEDAWASGIPSNTSKNGDALLSKGGLLSTPESIPSIIEKVFVAAAHGDAKTISNVLFGLSSDVINQVLHVPQRYAWCAKRANKRCEHVSIFAYAEWYPEKTQEECVVMALSVAAMARHKDVVQLLLDRGAAVNQTDRLQRTALHEACQFGHVEVVQCLLDGGARTDIADVNNNSCLMAACTGDKARVVKLLLERGLDPNQKTQGNKTALYVAAESNAVESARVLLHHGASVSIRAYCRTSPLTQAICRNSEAVAQLLLNSDIVAWQEEVQELQLCGAICVCIRQYDEALKVWEKAWRYCEPSVNDIAEDQTLEELLSLQNSHLNLMTESLLILERLLDPEDGIIFEMCLSICLWLVRQNHYTLALRVWNRGWRTLGRLFGVQKFKTHALLLLREMFEEDKVFAFDVIAESVLLAVEEIEQNLKVANGPYRDTMALCSSQLIFHARVAVRNDNDQVHLARLVQRLINVHPSIGCSSSILSCFLSLLDIFKDESARPMISDIVKLAVGCKADVDAVDEHGNTPLHKVALYSQHGDAEEACIIAKVLLDKNAHIDFQNSYGKTPMDLADPVLKQVILGYFPLSLKCLAASLIKAKVSFKGAVPPAVEKFIEKHPPWQGY